MGNSRTRNWLQRIRLGLLLVVSVYVVDAPLWALDGTYDATVTTMSGSYTVPVEVEDDAVTLVYWPNGGAMHVYDAVLEDCTATGTNSSEETIDIELDDSDCE